MFAEACPGNPSRVKQQAGVREVSSSLLRCCHHCHVQWCDRVLNSRLHTTIKDNTCLKKLLQKNLAATCPKSLGGMYSRSVHV